MSDLEMSLPNSLPQSVPPVPSHSPQPALAFPIPTNNEQIYTKGMLSDWIDSHDWTIPYDKTTLDNDEYVDFSVASDTNDDDTASSTDGLDDVLNLDSDLDYVEMGAGVDDEHGRLLTQPEIVHLQESWVEPTIVHCPGSQAGEVCSEGITVMQEYENALGGPSDNPYSLFSSQIDWELAKWAKLCGPSATSFTELLNIDGVSVVNEPLSFIISLLSSSYMNN